MRTWLLLFVVAAHPNKAMASALCATPEGRYRPRDITRAVVSICGAWLAAYTAKGPDRNTCVDDAR